MSSGTHFNHMLCLREMPLREGRMVLHDLNATRATGARLASCLQPGLLVTLSGELGTGKTTLVRAVLQSLGWRGAVKSPTYTLVEHYTVSSLYFYHFDFYRLDNPHEWETAGFSDYFSEGAVCLVEWPERVGEYLPRPDLAIELTYIPETPESAREITLRAYSAAGERCLGAALASAA